MCDPDPSGSRVCVCRSPFVVAVVRHGAARQGVVRHGAVRGVVGELDRPGTLAPVSMMLVGSLGIRTVNR